MLINIVQMHNDLSYYISWIKQRTVLVDYIGFLYFIVITISYILTSIFLKSSLIITLWTGSFNAIILGLLIIPQPWISEQYNIKKMKTLEKEKIRILLRTRLIEQLFIVELYQCLIFILVNINNLLFPIVDLILLRSIIFFAIITIFDIFILIIANSLVIRFGNYLKFIYFDMIPKKRPFDVSARDFVRINRLKQPWIKNIFSINLLLLFSFVFFMIYIFPLTIFCLIYGSVLTPPSGVEVDKFTQFVLNFSINYAIYWTIILNLLFVLAIGIIWKNLPATLINIKEKYYSIPLEYYDQLLRITDPKFHSIIQELAPEQNKI